MNISIHIQNLKDIKDLKLDFPIEKGLYVVTGANGTGKSTIMTVFSKISHGGSLNQFQSQDYSSETLITISYNGKINHWRKNKHHRGWSLDKGENEIHIEDFLILVEDVLAKNIIETIIDENHLYKSKLIQVLPVGGWENVPRMHDDIVKSQLVGPDTKIVSILDGDVEDDFNSKYKSKGLFANLTINFLDIPSLEKYLLDKLVINKDEKVFNEIGDRFFRVRSLKSIIDECQKKNNDKAFYRYLIKQVCALGTEEKVFITHVCKIVYEHENMKRNTEFLTRILTH